MSEIVIPDRGEFYRLIEQGQAVVLFTAPAWCVPCQRFEPHWTKAIEISEAKRLPYLFLKVDMGESPEAADDHWASKDFNILGVPQVKRFYDEDNWREIKARAVIPFLKEVEDDRA